VATKLPRINVVLERPLFDSVRRVSAREDLSLSNAARDLIREALELREDTALAALAEKRDRGYDWRRAATHEQVWGKRGRR